MKKFFQISLSFLIFILLSLIIILSTKGIETSKFNKIIYQKIENSDNDISLQLKKIKFKFDIKNFSLFLKTYNPIIKYQKLNLPIQEVRMYLDIFSFIKSKTKIEKINVISGEINIDELKKIILKTKPSNLNSLIVNKINKGTLTAELELYLSENLEIENIIVRGKVKKMSASIDDNLNLLNTNFDFFADPTDILIKNFNSNIDGFEIEDGDVRVEKKELIVLKSNFFSKVNIDKENFRKYSKFLKNIKNFDEEKIFLFANLNHNLELNFDQTYKLTDFSYDTKGIIEKLSLRLKKPYKSQFLKKEIQDVSLNKTNLSFNYNPKKKNIINIEGTYTLDNIKYQNFKFRNKFLDRSSNISSEIEYDDTLKLDVINYKKKEGNKARVLFNVLKKDNEFFIKDLDYKDSSNQILVRELKINKKRIISLKKIKVKTKNKNNINNDFSIEIGKSIKINGNRYDATNLNQIINQKGNNSFFENITKNIDIELKKIETPLDTELNNFKLLGKIQKGKFVKISSKGDFGNNKFLDITLKNDNNNKKKYLEIYSDLPRPLLSEYNFFKGLTGGTLIFSSVIELTETNSKLTIENFKIKNAPGLVKLLSLADFGGLADLAEGEGLSFEKLEMIMNNNKGFLKLEELYAVGPSISVLMEGYKESNGLISLRGTLVPAKNLNKFISKIPVIGKIVIPKDVGEGLFGVSFKIKGMPGEVKTTINPIKTLTPRFITKALEKAKKSK